MGMLKEGDREEFAQTFAIYVIWGLKLRAVTASAHCRIGKVGMVIIILVPSSPIPQQCGYLLLYGILKSEQFALARLIDGRAQGTCSSYRRERDSATGSHWLHRIATRQSGAKMSLL